jgi:hypothetical protein
MKCVAYRRVTGLFQDCSMKRSEYANQRDETMQYTALAERPATEDVDDKKKASEDNTR